MAFALSAFTLNTSKTIVTCSFGVARNKYVQFVSTRKKIEPKSFALKRARVQDARMHWQLNRMNRTGNIFRWETWTIEFAFFTRCAFVCEATRSIGRSSARYLVFGFERILGLAKETSETSKLIILSSAPSHVCSQNFLVGQVDLACVVAYVPWSLLPVVLQNWTPLPIAGHR